MSRFYIFHGDEYVRHSYGRGPDPTYPKKIRDVWSGWPSSWFPVSVDAALYYPGNNKFYIFHGAEYVRHSYGQGPDPTYPKKIRDVWSGWPSSWGSWDPTVRINAAFYYPGNDKFYIFHDDEYVRHSYGRRPDPTYPKKIRDVWSGWPGSWTAPFVQAALYHPGNDKIYLFQNDDYVRHSYGRGPDPGYPKEIDEVWSGWPREEWRDPPGGVNIRINAALYMPSFETFKLQLVALRCNDAQEATDEPYIRVNDSTVWGPASMHSRERRDLHRIEIDFSRTKNALIELKEHDRVRSDRIGSLTIDEETARRIAREGGDRTHTFRRDRGIVGDASYTLTYAVIIE